MQHAVLHSRIGGVNFLPVSLLAVTLQPFLAAKIEAVLATTIWPRWWLPASNQCQREVCAKVNGHPVDHRDSESNKNQVSDKMGTGVLLLIISFTC